MCFLFCIKNIFISLLKNLRRVIMNDMLSKKLAEVLGKVDEKVLQAQINAAVDMLQKGNTDELAKKLSKMDKSELLNKINDFDDSRLKDLKINKDDIKQKITDSDLNQLAKLIGDHGDEIVNKLKDIIK